MPSFWDKLQVDGQKMAVYSSVPSGSDPFPAVVIAHPVSGVNDGLGFHPAHSKITLTRSRP